VSASDARISWVDEQFLAEQQVEPWMGLPLWIPSSDPDMLGFADVDCRKAIADGLAFRALAATVADTLAWCRSRAADHGWRAGPTPERERALLAAWHSQGGPR
jgi:2'-hydroxyisoflavone reductase